MRFPDFLIIGAMKSGTTTLYRDLLTNPRIFMPLEKEPHSLCDDAVLADPGRGAYASLFEGAGADQLAGEASTGYTKLPDHPGVVARARALLPPHARFIYLVREPVSRTISHHRHVATSGRVRDPIDIAITSHPALINYSLYAMQVEPWLDAFGPDRVRVMIFERFVRDRLAAAEECARFLGIPARPELVEADRVFNPGDSKPVLSRSGPMRWVQQSWPYRRILRPMLSLEARERLRRALLPRATPRLAPPSERTIDLILERVIPDAQRLARLIGTGSPPWDFDEVRERLLSAPEPNKRAPDGVRSQ